MNKSDYLLSLGVAYNNAVWCDTVCRSHNITGEFFEDFWISQQQAPTYYPNVVTLSSTANLTSYQNVLTEFLAAQRDYAVSVKDSFAVLDLTPFGFHKLFQSQWIFKPASTDFSGHGLSDLPWQQVTSAEELLRWEEAWSHTTLPDKRIFLPPLLHDPDIAIMAAYKEDAIVAGAIANRTTDVVGISNVFMPDQEVEWYWEGLIRRISAYYPALPLVGYERDEDLTMALQVGFTMLGPLCVWEKEAS
jgi:hypothetical protein